MVKASKPFATEVALCAAFIADIGEDWIAYPETQGWDILLSRKVDGFQIGVQAKLKLNVRVIDQALSSNSSWTATHAGPDCRAILVPDTEAVGLTNLVEYLGIVLIRMCVPGKYPQYYSRNFYPGLPGDPHSSDEWHEWGHLKRYPLPEYVSDVVAGAPGPVQLTQWKIGALKIMATLELRGYVTRADFKHLKIGHRRWLSPGTLWLVGQKDRYVPGPRFPSFKDQHPRVYAEVLAGAKDWMLLGLPVVRRRSVR